MQNAWKLTPFVAASALFGIQALRGPYATPTHVDVSADTLQNNSAHNDSQGKVLANNLKEPSTNLQIIQNTNSVTENKISDNKHMSDNKNTSDNKRFSISDNKNTSNNKDMNYNKNINEKSVNEYKNIGDHINSKNMNEDKEITIIQKSETRSRISELMENLVINTQKDLVAAIEGLEGANGQRFRMDAWNRAEGGYGTTAVLQNGKVFEKAGVNISIIASPAPKPMLDMMRARRSDVVASSKDYTMFVAGISTVCHPHNPMAPTLHANYRYFELRENGNDAIAASWFGGGCDLTPCYLFEEDAVHFHNVIKTACDSHNRTYYPQYKKWCDKYFYNTHRGEGRGVGGIFFDDLESTDQLEIFRFVESCAGALVRQYVPIVTQRKALPFTEQQKQWQQIRRGRYVEFNLVHDRGTRS